MKIHVTPRGSKNEVTGWRGDALCVKITAPPVDGAANAAVVKFISELVKVRRSEVEIISGEKSREKTLKIHGLSASDLQERIGNRV